MKKLVMTFLVVSLFVTTALSLSSCKKTDTASTDKEWVPSTDDFVTYEVVPDDETGIRSYVECYYCGYHIPACPDDPPYINKCHFCPEHSHVHWFEADEDCYSPYQIGQCQYKFVRRHRLVITYAPLSGYYWHSFHAGGAGGGHE